MFQRQSSGFGMQRNNYKFVLQNFQIWYNNWPAVVPGEDVQKELQFSLDDEQKSSLKTEIFYEDSLDISLPLEVHNFKMVIISKIREGNQKSRAPCFRVKFSSKIIHKSV